MRPLLCGSPHRLFCAAASSFKGGAMTSEMDGVRQPTMLYTSSARTEDA